MKNIIRVSSILVSLALTGAVSASAGGSETLVQDAAMGKKNIVKTASAAGGFDILISAAKAAGLVETLTGEGPFTFFAPTDEAFGKLPEGTLVNLLKPENKAELAAILTYHLLPARVMAADVMTGSVATVNEAELIIKVQDGQLSVNDGNVVATDIECSNGVIHVIDTVLLPADASEAAQLTIR